MLLLVKAFVPAYNTFMLFEQRLITILIRKKKTLSLAESCTGGLLAHRLTNIPGSSKFVKCGIIAYRNEVKTQLLKVPQKIISHSGAVSEPVALMMAKNVRQIFKTDIGLAVTGIAGPTGATKTKPIGLTFIALSSSSEQLCLQYLFMGTRLEIKSQAVHQAIKLLGEFIS